MKASQRAMVAAIAAAAVNGKDYRTTYDYAQGGYIHTSVKMNGQKMTGYDYSRSAHVTGTLPGFYDYQEGEHFTLKVDGSKFSGYAYGARAHFSGAVRDGAVSLYDYETSSHYNFSVA